MRKPADLAVLKDRLERPVGYLVTCACGLREPVADRLVGLRRRDEHNRDHETDEIRRSDQLGSGEAGSGLRGDDDDGS